MLTSYTNSLYTADGFCDAMCHKMAGAYAAIFSLSGRAACNNPLCPCTFCIQGAIIFRLAIPPDIVYNYIDVPTIS